MTKAAVPDPEFDAELAPDDPPAPEPLPEPPLPCRPEPAELFEFEDEPTDAAEFALLEPVTASPTETATVVTSPATGAVSVAAARLFCAVVTPLSATEIADLSAVICASVEVICASKVSTAEPVADARAVCCVVSVFWSDTSLACAEASVAFAEANPD